MACVESIIEVIKYDYLCSAAFDSAAMSWLLNPMFTYRCIIIGSWVFFVVDIHEIIRLTSLPLHLRVITSACRESKTKAKQIR